MVNGSDPSTIAANPGAVIPGNSIIRVNNPSCSDPAKADNDLWLYQLYLLTQITDTGVLLLIQRIPISRRAAFYNVGYVAVFAIHTDDGQHIVQELASGAYKGLALQILLLSRSFADEHNICIPNTYTKNNIVSSLTKSATRAIVTFLLELFPHLYLSLQQPDAVQTVSAFGY